MELYFDKKDMEILRYIYKSGDKGARWQTLQEKFGEKANIFFLEELTNAEYTVTQKPDGSYIRFEDGFPGWNHADHGDFRSFTVSKGNKLIEDRFDRMWQWAIPVLISVAALIVSVLGSGFPEVVTVQLLK